MANLVMYREADGTVPFLKWLDSLPERAVIQARARLRLLAAKGHELRRPAADYLRDGIYELRLRSDLVRYRILYFFHGRAAVVISHGITKQEAVVPPIEIQRAVRRKVQFEADPAVHTFGELS